MIIDKLVAILGFEVDRKGLDEYQSRFKGLAGTVSKYIAEATAASLTLTKFAANTAEQIEKISERIQISTRSVQEFQHAATLAGESPEVFTNALEALKKKSEDVFLGDAGAIQSFMRLGLSIHDANGYLKSADDLLEDVADRITSITNPTIKRSILSGLGISEELLPLLEKGGGAISALRKRAGQDLYIFSDKDKDNLAEFNASFRSMFRLLDSIKNIFASKISPALSTMLVTVNQVLRGIKNITSSGLDGFFEGIAKTFDFIKYTLYISAKVLGPALLYVFESLKPILVGIGKILSAIFDPIYKIVEDIAVYLNGGNSVLGEMLKRIPLLEKGLIKALGIETEVKLAKAAGPLLKENLGGNTNAFSIPELNVVKNNALINPPENIKGLDILSQVANTLKSAISINAKGNVSQRLSPTYNITINANDENFAQTLENQLLPVLKSNEDRLWREMVLYNGGNNTI